jgi:hypothetical protein
MTYRIARISLVVILVSTLILPPPPAFACGPDFRLPDYTGFRAPDDRDFSYARGRLGLLQRGYSRIYLYEAYRNLSGKPFNDAELQALKDLSGGAQDQGTSAAKPEDWIAAWHELRVQTLGKPEGGRQQYYEEPGIVRTDVRDQLYRSYFNCFQDAFQNAVRTANDRKKQFGVENAVYKEYVVAQDQVFENCHGGPAVIPDAARAEDPEIIRADRAYQIAAAHFYAEEFPAAQAAFEQIAKDSSSPYRRIAPYLIARTLIREATIGTEEVEFDPDTMAQAEKQVRAVLADKDSAEFHRAAERLLGFVSIRLHPEERLHELELTVLDAEPSDSWGQDVTDYLWLFDHPASVRTGAISGHSSAVLIQTGSPPGQATPLKGSDLTDWTLTFRQNDDSAFQHSFERWHETKSLPWLVAALMKVNPKDAAAASELSAAASKITADSPAFLTLTFHRLRLLDQSGQGEKARRELDALLAQPAAAMPVSARNEFRALRMKLAANLSEFLQFAPRIDIDAAGVPPPAAGETGYKPGTPEYAATEPHFDSDASVVLTEKLPLRMLADAAKSNLLSANLRRDMAIAAWTRAMLLKNHSLAQELAPVLSDLVPEVKPALAEYSSADSENREFAAVFAILRNPGFRPFVSADPGRGWFFSVAESGFDKLDNFHDNWWCSFAPSPKDEYAGQNFYRMFAGLREPLRDIYPGGVVPEPAFLANADRSAAQEEQTALAASQSAPRWMGKLAVEWAKAHPDDARVPEALHLVVRAWRYGCTESSGENYSKAAFDLLHKRYPASEWTKQTPHWFN